MSHDRYLLQHAISSTKTWPGLGRNAWILRRPLHLWRQPSTRWLLGVGRGTSALCSSHDPHNRTQFKFWTCGVRSIPTANSELEYDSCFRLFRRRTDISTEDSVELLSFRCVLSVRTYILAISCIQALSDPCVRICDMNAIEEQFGEGKSLYEVLDISPTTDAANIKKAYYKAALKYVSSSFHTGYTLHRAS